MSGRQTIVMEPGDKQRLDHFLAAQFPDYSRSFLQRLIADGSILVDGKPARKSVMLKAGMELTIDWPEQKPLTLDAEDIDLPILYEDEQMVVINKPCDMTVHPGAGTQSGTVVNALLGYDFEQFQAMVDHERRPGIVHRLDKDTTGVMVVARTDQAKGALGQSFADREVAKQYLALVEGRLARKTVRVANRLGRHRVHRKRMAVVDRGGKKAISTFEHLVAGDGVSLVAATIETGRTHQIRVHLQSLGSGVIGDSVYGRRRAKFSAPRQLLHAWRLNIPHPATGKRVTFCAPVPDDMRTFATDNGIDIDAAVRDLESSATWPGEGYE